MNDQQRQTARTPEADLVLDKVARGILADLNLDPAEYVAAKREDRTERDRQIADEEWVDERLAEDEEKESRDE